MPDVAIETVELEPQPAMVVRRKFAWTDFGEALADILPRVYQHIVQAGVTGIYYTGVWADMPPSTT